MEIKHFGSVWKVVNVVDLSESEASLVSSDIKQSSFETNNNLLACTKCGTRRVGSCSCAKKQIQCTKNMKYQFACVYCNELGIDYTIPTFEDAHHREGETIILSQGQEVKIKYADNRPLSKINVGVGWDPATTVDNIDVDSSVVVLSNQGTEKDLVYFGAKEHPSGCVIHHGDNLTGMDIANSDDENISVFLNKVPLNRNRLVFVLNIYKCAERRQTFGKIKNLYIKLYDPETSKALVEYRVNGNFSKDTALIIGMAYRKNGSWLFRAIGKGSRATDVNQLANECEGVKKIIFLQKNINTYLHI